MSATVIPFPNPRSRRLSRWARAEVVQDSVRLLLEDGGPEIELWLSPSQARFWGDALRQLAEAAEGD